MNRERAKELLPVIKAFAEGKMVQCLHDDKWDDTSEPNWHPLFEYRIKPEPVLRPWKPEEVPVGAVIREIGTVRRQLIINADGAGFKVATYGCKPTICDVSFQGLAEIYEHSTDFGKTWHPCGVVEGGV